MGTPDTMDEGVVTLRSVTATSASVDFPEVIIGDSSTGYVGTPAKRGIMRRIAVRTVTLHAIRETFPLSEEWSEMAYVPIACAPLLVEETNHDYETTGDKWFCNCRGLNVTDVMKSHCSRSVTWRTLYP